MSITTVSSYYQFPLSTTSPITLKVSAEGHVAIHGKLSVSANKTFITNYSRNLRSFDSELIVNKCSHLLQTMTAKFEALQAKTLELQKVKLDSVVTVIASLRENIITHFTRICADYQTKKEAAADGSWDALNTGYWYAQDVFFILHSLIKKDDLDPAIKEQAQIKLDELVGNGAFHRGIPPEGMEFVIMDMPPRVREQYGELVASGILSETYQLNANTLPSTALHSVIRSSLCFVDCGMTIQIAHYLALFDLLGKEAFDTFFSAKNAYPFVLCGNIKKPESPIKSLVTSVRLDKKNRLQKGDLRGFPNHHMYHKKHILGHGNAFNTIFLGKDKHLGFGLSSVGVTTDEIKATLTTEFNREQFSQFMVTDEHILALLKLHNISLEKAMFLGKSFLNQKDVPEPDTIVERIVPDQFLDYLLKVIMSLNQEIANITKIRKEFVAET